MMALVIVGAMIFLILKWLNHTTDHGEFVIVPDLTTLSLEEAQAYLKREKLRSELLDTANYNPKFPPSSVIEQIPEAGDKVKENRRIYLRVNRSGYPEVKVPNVIQITKRNAITRLRAAGLEIGEEEYIDGIGEDMVYEIWHDGKKIAPGAAVSQTSRIDLVLGNGKRSKRRR